MTDPTGTHHSVDYIELCVSNMARAKAFYIAAFGWKLTDYGPGYAGFVDHARGDREAGGLRLVDAVTRGGPLVVLYSKDLEASAKAVHEAGGKIKAEIYVFPGGRRFEFEDPSGNHLAIWGK